MSTIPSVLMPRTFVRLDNFMKNKFPRAGHLSIGHPPSPGLRRGKRAGVGDTQSLARHQSVSKWTKGMPVSFRPFFSSCRDFLAISW